MMTYLIIAYSLIALVLSGYGLSIWRRWCALQVEILDYTDDVGWAEIESEEFEYRNNRC